MTTPLPSMHNAPVPESNTRFSEPYVIGNEPFKPNINVRINPNTSDFLTSFWETAKPYIPNTAAVLGVGVLSLGVYNYISLKADDPEYASKRNASILRTAMGVATVAFAVVAKQTNCFE